MLSREDVGRIVRETWEAWAREQPDVAEHPSWLVPWESLPERDREVDMRIGDAVVSTVYPKLRADVERLTRELAEARAAILYFAPRCGIYDRAKGAPCGRAATHEHEPPARWTSCDEHKGARDSAHPHAPAIRAAEGET